MLKELLAFLNEIKIITIRFYRSGSKLSKMDNFINNYNAESPALIDVNSDGIIVLQRMPINIWNYRLYVPIGPKEEISHLFKRQADIEQISLSIK